MTNLSWDELSPTNPTELSWDSLSADPPVAEQRRGLIDTVIGGAVGTARGVGAAADLYQGDNEELATAVREQRAERKDPRLEAFMSEIAAWKKGQDEAGKDPSWFDSAKALGSAAWNNPAGAGLMIAEQLPNSAVALGAGYGGMKAGGLIGTAIAGPAGTLPGAVIGGLAGLFTGNTALETGNKAIEAAQAGPLSDDQRYDVMGEGARKGAVITGIDALTLGATSVIGRATARAVERATAKTLADAGIDVADKAAVLAARQNPKIVSAVQSAQKAAVDATTTLGQRVARTGGQAALETFGEGAGEYLGEYAASGEFDKVEALIEAFSSAGTSAAEIVATRSWNEKSSKDALWGDAPAPVASPESPKPAREFTPELRQGLLEHANQRIRELEAKANGTPDQKIKGPDGKDITIPGRVQEFMSPAEKAELAFLRATGDDTDALARAYFPEVDNDEGFLHSDGDADKAAAVRPTLTDILAAGSVDEAIAAASAAISAPLTLTGQSRADLMAPPEGIIGAARAYQEQVANDQADLESLVSRETRDLQVMRAQALEDMRKARDLDAIQETGTGQYGVPIEAKPAVQEAATLEAPTAMQLAMQRAQQRQAPSLQSAQSAGTVVAPEQQTPGSQGPGGMYRIADAISADGPTSETVKVIVRPDGIGALQRDNGDVIDITNMLRAGFSVERALAQTLGDDTSGKNVSRENQGTAPAAPESAPAPRQPDILPADITRLDGKPFQTANGARLKQREAGGIDGSDVVQIGENAFVVRPKPPTAAAPDAGAVAPDAPAQVQPLADSAAAPTDPAQPNIGALKETPSAQTAEAIEGTPEQPGAEVPAAGQPAADAAVPEQNQGAAPDQRLIPVSKREAVAPTTSRGPAASDAWRNEGKSPDEMQAEKVAGLADELSGQVADEASEKDFAPSELPAAIAQWAKDGNVPADEMRQALLKALEKRGLSDGRMKQIRDALNPVKQAQKAPDPRLVPVSKRTPAAPVDLTDDETTAEFERLYQEDVKADIRRRLGMEPQAKAADVKQSPFRTFLREFGINTQHASDITGERGFKANNRLPAMFRKRGRNLDELAQLAVERGFLTQADIESADDNGGTNKLLEMIRAELRGERQDSNEFADENAGADLDRVRRMELEEMADSLGIQYEPDMDDGKLASMVARVQAALDASKEPKGSLKADRVLANAIAAAKRIEAKREQYERDLEEFAKASIREQNAFLEVLLDEDGTPVVNRLADQQADDAWNELLGAWEDQNGQTETTEEPASRQAGPPDGAGAAQRPVDAQEGDSGQQRRGAESQEEGLTAPTRADVLRQQAQAEAEAQRREDGGDKPLPGKKVTGDTPDMFNTQGSVFDQPAEPEPATQAATILDAANVTGKDRLDILKDVKSGALTPGEVQAAFPGVEQPTSKKRLTDAGEELIRNRRGKLKGLAWDDVSAMNDTLKVAQVIKSNVWPRPDYAKMVEDGAPAWKAAALKAVYDKLAAAPVTRTAPTDSDLRAYIETMNQVREALMAELDRVERDGTGDKLWASLQARNVFGKVFPVPADAKPMFGAPSPFDRKSEQGKENNRRALLIGGNGAIQALQFNYKVTSKVKDLLADGFPKKQEAWEKSYEVRQSETRDNDVPQAERNGESQQRFYVYEKGSRWRLAKGVQDGGYATQEQAEAFARTLTARKRDVLPPSRGLDLADVKRTGPDWRGGKNVTSDQVMEHFGFRGVNLGEYVKAKQDIAQLHLNHVFDAFSDLADLLGVPPKAMSLNGTLGVAVGAQGSGKALAHFAPGVNEINITRDSGAGALAHEFGHAVDHYFATQHGRATSMAKRPYLSAAIDRVGGDAGGVRPEVIEAMRAVMKAINSRPMTEEEAKKYMADQRTLNQRRMDRWVAEFKDNRGADPAALAAVAEKLKRGDVGEVRDDDVETNLAEFMRAAGLKPGNMLAANAFTTAYRLRDLADEARFMASHIPQMETNYSKASAALDAKKTGDGYWGTPWEKFARAFETFVMDALADRQRESLYLSGLVDSKGWQSWSDATGKSIPYPAGDERLVMQQAFQKLVDTIQTREDDVGNVALFARSPFYSALSREVGKINAKAQSGGNWALNIQGLVKAGKVKQDEVHWTGILDWLRLQEGKVSKEQVAAFLDQNGVKVEETVLSDFDVRALPSGWDVVSNENGEWAVRNERGEVMGEGGTRAEAIENAQDEDALAETPGAPKYGTSNLVLPGGTNYREVLLTLPAKTTADPARAEYEAWASRNGLQPNATFTEERYKRETGNDAPAPRTMTAMNADAAQNFKSSHWDQPNVLAHIRVNDRTAMADGFKVVNKKSGNAGQTFDTRAQAEANIATYPEAMRASLVVKDVQVPKKVLFVEEIQSDWGQQGKKQGFQPGQAGQRRFQELGAEWDAIQSAAAAGDKAAQTRQGEISDEMNAISDAKRDGLPAAPFVQKTDAWLSLALKRIVKMAADGGYDRVAFVTGEQSAERYDLSKQVRSIVWTGRGNDTEKRVTITPNDGNDIEFMVQPDGAVGAMGGRSIGNEFDGKRLDEIVGKEVAERIMGQTHGDMRGNGLKVGGSGMKAFYDTIVPNTLKDVLKKLGGGALETVEIATDKTASQVAENRIRRQTGEVLVDQKTLQQPGFTLSDAILAKASEDLPQFSRQGGRGVSMDDAKAIVAAVREALPTAPPIYIMESIDKAPDELRADIEKAGAERDVDAAFHNGEIYVFPGNIGSVERMMFVLAHHEIRHYGLRATLGPKAGPIFLAIHATNPKIRELAAEQVEKGYANSRVLAVEEALADMPVDELVKLNGFDKIIAALRDMLRRIAGRLRLRGFANLADAITPKNWTDKDVAALIARAEGVSRGGSARYQTEGTVFGKDAVAAARDEVSDTDDSMLANSATQKEVDGHADVSAEEAQKVQAGIEGKTVSEVAQWMAENAPTEDFRLIADRVLNRLRDLQLAGMKFTFKVSHVGDRVPSALIGTRGMVYRPNQSDVSQVWVQGADVTGYVGTSYEVVLHELLHAVTQTALHVGNRRVALGTKLNESYMALHDVSNAIVQHFNGQFAKANLDPEKMTPFERSVFLRLNNSVASEGEVISWAMTNRPFQEYLESIPYKSRNLWNEFVASVRRLLGLTATADTALSEVLRVTDDILSFPAVELLSMADQIGLPTQINRAGGLLNNASSDGADIRFARSAVTGKTLPQAWQAPDQSKLDDFLYSMQDKHIDTKRVVTAVRAAIGGIADNLDPYLQEELYHGRSAMATKEFLEKSLRPLLTDMQARGIEMSDFEEYLHNRHAERRNVQVAKVNPNMQDGGSGIKTADARAYLNGLPAAKRTAYQALAKRVDKINRDTRDLLVSSGLEKQSTIAAWDAAYGDEYVPLMREEMDNGAMGIGQGFSVRGGSSKRAMGSNKPVANILANIALQREKAITRAEKRRIGEALYGMVLSAPNPDFWFAVDPALQQNPAQITATAMQLISMGLNPADAQSIAAEPTQRYIDPRTGQVAERINPALRSADNVLAVRIDGEDKYVFFNAKDERAMRMAKALKNLDADQLGTVMGSVAKVTRYFAAVNTQFNPIFGVVNLTRDIQTALLNLQSTALKGKQADVMKHVGSALRGIYIDLRDHRAGKQPTSTWAGLFEEFQREGGATGFRDMYANAEERKDAIVSELKAIKAGTAMKVGRGIFGWLSDYNESMENAVRLAAYKVALEQGMSKQQAASLAKNLTVNFNRGGQVKLQAGALYAFFNAAVQGSARMAQTMFEPGKFGKLTGTGKRIIQGGLLLGSMQALLFAAAGYDDDEPPDFVRERALVIPIGGDKYVSIPMPLGFHVIPNLARIPTEWALGGFKNTPKRIGQMVGLFADAFNPIGSAGLSLQTLTPTIIDPLAALSENRDWTGKPISKQDFSSLKPTAGHTRAKDTATPWAKAIAYGLNIATGGTDYKPGLASPTPDQIDYLIGQATGGVGREVSKLSQVAGSTLSGEELPLYKIPLVGRFVGTTTGQAAESSRFYDNLREIGEHDAELDGLKKDRRMSEYSAYMRENPQARLAKVADRTYREVSKLNRAKRDAIKNGAKADRVKLFDQQITARMAAFNALVKATGTRETATQE